MIISSGMPALLMIVDGNNGVAGGYYLLIISGSGRRQVVEGRLKKRLHLNDGVERGTLRYDEILIACLAQETGCGMTV